MQQLKKKKVHKRKYNKLNNKKNKFLKINLYNKIIKKNFIPKLQIFQKQRQTKKNKNKMIFKHF